VAYADIVAIRAISALPPTRARSPTCQQIARWSQHRRGRGTCERTSLDVVRYKQISYLCHVGQRRPRGVHWTAGGLCARKQVCRKYV